jgi:hypothetical protein
MTNQIFPGWTVVPRPCRIEKEINGPMKGFRLLGTVDMLKCHRNHCPGKHNANAWHDVVRA